MLEKLNMTENNAIRGGGRRPIIKGGKLLKGGMKAEDTMHNGKFPLHQGTGLQLYFIQRFIFYSISVHDLFVKILWSERGAVDS